MARSVVASFSSSFASSHCRAVLVCDAQRKGGHPFAGDLDCLPCQLVGAERPRHFAVLTRFGGPVDSVVLATGSLPVNILVGSKPCNIRFLASLIRNSHICQ